MLLAQHNGPSSAMRRGAWIIWLLAEIGLISAGCGKPAADRDGTPSRPNHAAVMSPLKTRPEIDLSNENPQRAVWNGHWSFKPLKASPSAPEVVDTEWPHNGIDRFILHKLEEVRLSPAPPANQYTLLRRLTYDLIGLPPTISEIEEFVSDDSPTAYSKVVERLLASPHFGERWGRHWLDIVRFAESYGSEFDDEIPGAFLYRDYVIRAFNEDIPYDEFVVEHLAGDLLRPPRRNQARGFNESILGTCFFHFGEAKTSPVDVLEEQAVRHENQIEVIGKAFLALNLACARCHDHKSEPITMADYYAMVGSLESSRLSHAFIDDNEQNARAVARLREFDRQSAKQLVEAAYGRLRANIGSFADGVTSLEVQEARPIHNGSEPAVLIHEWRQLMRTAAESTDDILFPWLLFRNVSPRGANRHLSAARDSAARTLSARESSRLAPRQTDVVLTDFSDGRGCWSLAGLAVETPSNESTTAVVRSHGPNPIGAIVPRGVLHSGLCSNRLQGVARSPDFTVTQQRIWFLAAGKASRINIVVEGFRQFRYPIYGSLSIALNWDEPRWCGAEISTWKGRKAYIEVLDDADGYFLLDQVIFSDEPDSPARPPNNRIRGLLDNRAVVGPRELLLAYQSMFADALDRWINESADDPLTGDDIAFVNWLLAHDEFLAALHDRSIESRKESNARRISAEVVDLVERRAAIERTLRVPRVALVMTDGTSQDASIELRGDPHRRGALVARGGPLGVPFDDPIPPSAGSRRLEIARRLFQPPLSGLVARVAVNRLWLHYFGAGLVNSPDDFGHTGGSPSHPALLDYLARTLIDNDWSLKTIHREIVLSATYQLASTSSAEAMIRDPENRLLQSMRPRRLDAECIRDAILLASSNLDRRLYGPSTFAPAPPAARTHGTNQVSRFPQASCGERRSIYLPVRRNSLPELLVVFDFPSPVTTVGGRGTTTTPAQALALLNNPFVAAQAAAWARQILDSAPASDEDRVKAIFMTGLGRKPDATELDLALRFVSEQKSRHRGDEVLNAWADLCHLIYNIEDFINLQ